MRTILTLLLALFAMTVQASDWQGRYMVRGGIHCVTYLAQYNSNLRTRMADDQVTSQFAQTHGWIKGYLTAYNAFTDNGLVDIQRAFSGNRVEQWLASHCEENQQNDLADAMKALIAMLRDDELQAHRGAEPPRARRNRDADGALLAALQ
jgi:hypothetical protein